jgi:hypothetical protein
VLLGAVAFAIDVGPEQRDGREKPDQERCVERKASSEGQRDGYGALAQNSSPPSAAAGLRRQFSPARPPGLGGGHCALGLVDAVAHEPCGGSPVQGYKG